MRLPCVPGNYSTPFCTYQLFVHPYISFQMATVSNLGVKVIYIVPRDFPHKITFNLRTVKRAYLYIPINS